MRALRLLVVLALTITAASMRAAASQESTSSFQVRMVKLSGSPADPTVRGHLEFCAGLGFNALWVYAPYAGRWTPRDAPQGPFLDPAFLDVARWCDDRGIRIFVSVNPVADSGGAFVFSDPEGERRIRTFFRLLGRRAQVRDFVLSFDDQPTELTELRDLLRYGRSAAPAHLDLTRQLARHLRKSDRLWLCASAYCDTHLGDGSGRYAAPFLALLPTLPASVGIVWTGPTVVPPSITASDIAAARARLGGREILLYDNFSAIDVGAGAEALAAYLGPLRGRDPRLAEAVPVYLACPMSGPGTSRLALLTVADFFRGPATYDPDESLRAAMARLAGPDRFAADALRVQALEWRGWEKGAFFRPWDPVDPNEAAESLDDPALVAAWEWTASRYPDRMAALSGLADAAFRDELLVVMARRLAVSRSVPLAVEYLARVRANRRDLDPLLDAFQQERTRAASCPAALRGLDRFLRAAGIEVKK